MRRLFGWTRWTIWAPGAIPDNERKYAVPLKRFALPAYDIIMVFAGIFAISIGIPSLDRVLPPEVADLLGYAFVAVALSCLAGISFPRLYLLETVGKWFLFGFLGTYAIALVIVDTQAGTMTRSFVLTIVLAAMVVPPLRLWILGREWRDRRDAVKAAEQLARALEGKVD